MNEPVLSLPVKKPVICSPMVPLLNRSSADLYQRAMKNGFLAWVLQVLF